jgi:uncharacterized repeat protein (TIGR01451 family)
MTANLRTLTSEKSEVPMKRLLMPATTLTTLKKVAFTLFCCTVLMVCAAPAQAQAPSGLAPGVRPSSQANSQANSQVNKQATTVRSLVQSNEEVSQSYNVSGTWKDSYNYVWTLTENPSTGAITGTVVGCTPNGTVTGTATGAQFTLVVTDPPSCYDYEYNMTWVSATSAQGTWFNWCVGESGDQCGGASVTMNLTSSTQYTLTLTELGLGNGNVTDNTGQINCSEADGTVKGTCSASYAIGTLVILTASPNLPSASTPPSTFGGWAGACLSNGNTLTCDLTMDSAKNVTAIFNVPGPTQVGVVTTSAPTVFNFNGGFVDGSPTSGYDYTAQLTSGSPVTVQVTAIDPPQQDCNALVNPTFPGAECFVYQNGGGQGVDVPVMFEVTCPPSGTCGSGENPPFNATLGTDFNFLFPENLPLAIADENGLPHLTSSDGLPAVGFLKGVGLDPLHPCTPYLNNSPPLFQSNQIISVAWGGASPVHAGSGGTGSCWLVTYHTPGELPTVSITAPVNGGIYQQNSSTSANYTCTAVNNSNINGGAAGPYLTVPPGSCNATDTPGGSVANGAQFDTGKTGLHTFTATVEDSATNTNSSTVTYNVVGATDVAILKLAPRRIRTGSKLTYLIGVGDLGNVNAVNVSVNDPLPPGTIVLSASGTNFGCSIVNGKFTCSTTPVPCAFAGGTVSCNVGTIMPFSFFFLNGAVMQVTVQVTAPAGTVLTNTATVSESNADTNPSNNTSTASTTVTSH